MAFALPAMGIIAVRMIVPVATPPSAYAAADASVTPTPSPVLPGIGDVDRALMQSFAEAEANAPQRLTLGIGVVRSEAPTGKRRDSQDLPTGIVLSSVMKVPGGAVAVIQSKLYRVGDKVTPEWTVTAIDDRARTAELTHESGDRRTLSIER